VAHKTGIPHSPTGQAVIERAHNTLKRTLERQWEDDKSLGPQQRLQKALFTINFLNCSFENLNPPVLWHFNQHLQLKVEEKPPVLVKDPETWE
ncbi:POK18 protein, partial [Polioptila caerulea]|nr:POK18 protein [Polioptila caerulea]